MFYKAHLPKQNMVFSYFFQKSFIEFAWLQLSPILALYMVTSQLCCCWKSPMWRTSVSKGTSSFGHQSSRLQLYFRNEIITGPYMFAPKKMPWTMQLWRYCKIINLGFNFCFVGGLEFKSRAGQILHSFGNTCVDVVTASTSTQSVTYKFYDAEMSIANSLHASA